jgi:hypothetical protein
MTKRAATCSCGQLTVRCEGEPVRISICHCLACQKRTGSVFSAQARFNRDQVLSIAGQSTAYVRKADSGNELTFHFCPMCGSTVYYWLNHVPEIVAIPVGAFADPQFGPPKFSVYESRKHSWVRLPEGPGIEHLD